MTHLPSLIGMMFASLAYTTLLLFAAVSTGYSTYPIQILPCNRERSPISPLLTTYIYVLTIFSTILFYLDFTSFFLYLEDRPMALKAVKMTTDTLFVVALTVLTVYNTFRLYLVWGREVAVIVVPSILVAGVFTFGLLSSRIAPIASSLFPEEAIHLLFYACLGLQNFVISACIAYKLSVSLEILSRLVDTHSIQSFPQPPDSQSNPSISCASVDTQLPDSESNPSKSCASVHSNEGGTQIGETESARAPPPHLSNPHPPDPSDTVESHREEYRTTLMHLTISSGLFMSIVCLLILVELINADVVICVQPFAHQMLLFSPILLLFLIARAICFRADAQKATSFLGALPMEFRVVHSESTEDSQWFS